MTIPKPGVPFYRATRTQFNEMWERLADAFTKAESSLTHAELCYTAKRIHQTARFAWPCHEFGTRKKV